MSIDSKHRSIEIQSTIPVFNHWYWIISALAIEDFGLAGNSPGWGLPDMEVVAAMEQFVEQMMDSNHYDSEMEEVLVDVYKT